jgi:hypothetical protein
MASAKAGRILFRLPAMRKKLRAKLHSAKSRLHASPHSGESRLHAMPHSTEFKKKFYLRLGAMPLDLKFKSKISCRLCAMRHSGESTPRCTYKTSKQTIPVHYLMSISLWCRIFQYKWQQSVDTLWFDSNWKFKLLNNVSQITQHCDRMNTKKSGLWIRIDSSRIRIQHFSSIRIHKIFESGSNADPDPQRKISRQKYLQFLLFPTYYSSYKNVQNLKKKCIFFFIYLAHGSGFRIRIRIYKVIESVSTTLQEIISYLTIKLLWTDFQTVK